MVNAHRVPIIWLGVRIGLSLPQPEIAAEAGAGEVMDRLPVLAVDRRFSSPQAEDR
jgi:hypothetical protein